jgi:hypothetical protein
MAYSRSTSSDQSELKVRDHHWNWSDDPVILSADHSSDLRNDHGPNIPRIRGMFGLTPDRPHLDRQICKCDRSASVYV